MLDGERLRSVPDLPPALRAARQNFLFVPPNLLLIDEFALLEILLESTNDMLALVNFVSMASNDRGLREGLDLQTSVVLNRVAREYLRAENIRMFRKEGVVAPGATEARDVWASPENADNFKAFGASIAFIFLHEFGHHAHAGAGAFDLGLERIGLFLKDTLITSRIRAEEAAADTYAARLFKVYLHEQVESGVPPIMLFEAAQTLVRNFKAVHYLKMFDGLRGFAYRDLYVSLYHRECEEWTSKSNTQRERSVLNDLGYLYRVEDRDMILLSEEEYGVVRKKLLENLVSTHPYPASRGADMFNAVLSMNEFAGLGATATLFAKDIETIEAIKNDERAHAGPALGAAGDLRLTLSDVLSGVDESGYKVKKAVNCPVEADCSIVEFMRSGQPPFGYLEFATEAGSVRLFKFYVSAPLLDFFRPGTNYSEAERERRLEERLQVLPLFANVLKLPATEVLATISGVLMQGAICGASGVVIDGGDRTVGITSLARKDWIRLDLLDLGLAK